MADVIYWFEKVDFFVKDGEVAEPTSQNIFCYCKNGGKFVMKFFTYDEAFIAEYDEKCMSKSFFTDFYHIRALKFFCHRHSLTKSAKIKN